MGEFGGATPIREQMMSKIQKVALVTCAILIGCGSVNAAGDKAFSGRAAVSRPFGGVLAQNGDDIGAMPATLPGSEG
jgi:hypothetical protein